MSATLTASETLNQGCQSDRMNLPQTASRRTELVIASVGQQAGRKVRQ
jgi:hypothetical protein